MLNALTEKLPARDPCLAWLRRVDQIFGCIPNVKYRIERVFRDGEFERMRRCNPLVERAMPQTFEGIHVVGRQLARKT